LPTALMTSKKLFLLLLVSVAAIAFAADSKLVAKFKNFECPFPVSAEWPNQLEWQNVNEPNKITLADGKWREPDSGSDMPFRGLTLESLKLGDVTGDGVNDAIVVLRHDTGGTQYSHYVYIYSLRRSAPELLAYFHSGDRAASGLYRVYAERGNLVVELFDPAKQRGDCCSAGFVRKRFHWSKSEFRQVGKDEFGIPKATSRLAVDTFGHHHN
jgi:hypothetical protein